MRAPILRPEAEAEVEEAFRWYEERNPSLGADFLRMVDAALSGIRSHPKHYPQVHKAARQVVLRRFPFSLTWSCPLNGDSSKRWLTRYLGLSMVSPFPAPTHAWSP